MLSYEVVAYIVCAVVVLGCMGLAATVALVWAVRKLTLGAVGAVKPENATYAPSGVENGVLAGMAERTAVLEGKFNALVPLIEGYGTVQARMSALEAHVPSIIDVTEKLTQNVQNSDKRRTMQERRAAAKDEGGESVDAAFAVQQMGLAGSAAQVPTTADVPQPQRRAGVLGQGGNGRPRN